METIEALIRQTAAEQFADFSYVFENWEDADAKLEKIQYPAIVCVLPTGGSVSMRTGRVFDTEYIALAFLDLAPMGAEGEDNEVIYTRMKQEGIRFIKALNNSRKIEPIHDAQYDTICEQLATVVTGVIFQLTIRQSKGQCL